MLYKIGQFQYQEGISVLNRINVDRKMKRNGGSATLKARSLMSSVLHGMNKCSLLMLLLAKRDYMANPSVCRL